jgi:putative transposase
MDPIRKKMVRQEVPGTARFLTFSCYRRLPLFNNDQIKDRFVEVLNTSVTKLPIDVLAWVVMPEHVHLVLFPREAGLVTPFLTSLKSTISREVLARWRELDAPILPRLDDGEGYHFWQLGGGYDRNVVGQELLEKIAYCHRNPITRGLVKTSSEWKWSSARAYERLECIGPAITFDLVPPHTKRLT